MKDTAWSDSSARPYLKNYFRQKKCIQGQACTKIHLLTLANPIDTIPDYLHEPGLLFKKRPTGVWDNFFFVEGLSGIVEGLSGIVLVPQGW